jgi:LuxR family transcriptional regulator, activator of conjugal transfer of Ti plasmids
LDIIPRIRPQPDQQAIISPPPRTFAPVTINLASARKERFLWDSKELPSNNLQRRFFREAKDFGIYTGITIPLQSGFGRKAAMTFAGSLLDRSKLLEKTSYDFLQTSVMYFHTFYEVFSAKNSLIRINKQPLLTPRQKQCLRWLAEGKTLSEISTLLEITLRTVNLHVSEIRMRLNANTLPQAVALAIKYGEINI